MKSKASYREIVHRAAGAALVLMLAAPLAAQQPTIRRDCCALLYSTGRWLGWSTSFLEYTRMREAPSPADAIVLQSLELAGRNAEAANAACLQDLQAWPGWRQKQLWLANHVAELQRPSDPVKSHAYRRQLAASAIEGTYSLWGEELSVQRLDGQLLRQPTCATYYFRLGFDLAYATQAYRQADEAYVAGDRQSALHQLNQTRMRLHKAVAILQGYGAIQRRISFPVVCADIGLDRLQEMIQNLATRPPSFGSYQDELRIVSGISDRVGELLLANCPLLGGQGSAAPNIVGRWELTFGGHPSPVGTVGENVIRNRGELIITRNNGGYQATFRVYPLPWEDLLDVTYSDGVLRFTRSPRFYLQYFEGTVIDNGIDGTFSHRGLSYRWWGQKRD
jgi:hypothetical protein